MASNVNEDVPSQSSATIIDRDENLTMSLEEEQAERTKRSKRSDRKQDKKSKKEKKEELKMLSQIVRELRQKLMRVSEQCVEVSKENEILLDELKAEYGSNAISDILAANRASSSLENHRDGEIASGDVSTTDEQKKKIRLKITYNAKS